MGDDGRKLIIAKYGAKNLTKVMKNLTEGPGESKKKFLKKYPYANLDKFEFEVVLDDTDGDIEEYKVFYKVDDTTSYDVKSETFKTNRNWKKALYWKEIWQDTGTVQPFKKNTSGLVKKINEIIIYVAKSAYFYAKFTPPTIESTNTNDYKTNGYLASLFAAYISTYSCGISTKHLVYSGDVPRAITSLMRYHIFFHISRFLKNPSLMDQYITADIRKIIQDNKPVKYVWERKKFVSTRTEKSVWYNQQPNKSKIHNVRYAKNSRGSIAGLYYDLITSETITSLEDYKLFIATETNGFTKLGAKLLQQTIESFVYGILGAQARTRWAIVGAGAKSSQTQDVFKQIIRDTIIQTDDTVTIANMRRAISATNVVLNMAISPGVILLPSNMIILKKKLPGYNNILTLAHKGMAFGTNDNVNYDAKLAAEEEEEEEDTPSSPEKPQTTPTVRPASSGTQTSPTVSSTTTTRITPTVSSDSTVTTFTPVQEVPQDHTTDLAYISVIMLTLGGMVAKFLI